LHAGASRRPTRTCLHRVGVQRSYASNTLRSWRRRECRDSPTGRLPSATRLPR
jgi:hypothetical protein